MNFRHADGSGMGNVNISAGRMRRRYSREISRPNHLYSDDISKSRIDEHNRHKTRYDFLLHPIKQERNECMLFLRFSLVSVCDICGRGSPGTSSIVHETTHQPLLSTLSRVVETVVRLKSQGHKVVLVSSGAIGVGLKRMEIPSRPKSLSGKQASQTYPFFSLLF